ncbi:MAG: tetratricopeptide repeat protein [Myxococcales bacterium]|nr:tetratricopeptide repeat protein [Myxococcales bacterium]MDH5305792.1 tetratricopeptide repeat protein [Myxococcales bacterium]MDH5565787.1 tetratricopeptide repeat protein [Myxococcales bacterium]
MARPDARVLAARVEQLRAILARDADDATAWFGLGRALFELDRPEEAVEPLRRAIALDPDYTAAQRDLGRSLLESGAAREAADVLREALEIAQRTGDLQTGREVEVFLQRARQALGEERPVQKPARPARAAHIGPVDPEASAAARRIYKSGFEHFIAGRCDEAVALYERALEIDPGLAIAWNGLSLAQRQRGDLDAGIRAAQRLIELEPDDPLSHTNLSILYVKKGMIPEAEEERALAMQLQLRAQRGA